jgi:hypothetical protein
MGRATPSRGGPGSNQYVTKPPISGYDAASPMPEPLDCADPMLEEMLSEPATHAAVSADDGGDAYEDVSVPGWHGLGPVGVSWWVNDGWTQQSAEPWLAEGVLDPVDARSFGDAGFSPADTAAWQREVGMSSGPEARRWADEGFGPTEETFFYRYGGAQPEEASRWRSAGVSGRDMARWRTAAFSPAEAGEHVAAGRTTAEAAAHRSANP